MEWRRVCGVLTKGVVCRRAKSTRGFKGGRGTPSRDRRGLAFHSTAIVTLRVVLQVDFAAQLALFFGATHASTWKRGFADSATDDGRCV